MKVVDTHCHLFDIKNYELPEHIEPIIIGYSHSSNKKALQYADKYIYSLGVAPQTAIKSDIKYLDEWCEFIEKNKPYAVGEVGLDYKWAENEEQVKLEHTVFNRMIEISEKLKVPLVIHSRNGEINGEKRDAVEDIIKILGKRKYLMHFFSGTVDQAEEIVENGGIISIIHLHSKSRKEVIKRIDLDKLVVETDSPYVGRTPELVLEAIKYIAEVKNIKVEEVAEQTAKNAYLFFKGDNYV